MFLSKKKTYYSIKIIKLMVMCFLFSVKPPSTVSLRKRKLWQFKDLCSVAKFLIESSCISVSVWPSGTSLH